MQRRPTKLTLDVVAELADQIVGSGLPAGTLLPSETEMSENFGVSRTVVREALNVLENIGLIQKRKGKLSCTSSPDRWDILDPIVLAAQARHDPDFAFVEDLVTVRIALESEMAALAATRATDEEFEAIAGILEGLRGLLDEPEQYKDAETSFHNAVMRSARSRVGLAIVVSIHDKARASGAYYKGASPRELVQLSHKGHLAIFDRLRARDSAGAALAMRQHISSTWAWRRDDAVGSGSAASSRSRRAGGRRPEATSRRRS